MLKFEFKENLSFVIFFKNNKKSLNLIAFSEEDRKLWVDSLNFYIDVLKKNKNHIPEADNDTDTEDYFKQADRSNDRLVDKREISKFLESINLKMDKKQLKDLIKVRFNFFIID